MSIIEPKTFSNKVKELLAIEDDLTIAEAIVETADFFDVEIESVKPLIDPWIKSMLKEEAENKNQIRYVTKKPKKINGI